MSGRKKYFKYCIVPGCPSTNVKMPEKLFISLPSDVKLRREWQHAMRRLDLVGDRGTRFCCQDHFNIEEDIENYLYLKMMKSGTIRLKPGVIPHIFDCQTGRSTSLTSKGRLLEQKREQKAIIEELLREHEKEELIRKILNEAPQEPTSVDQGMQVNRKPLRRSKAIQCVISVRKTKRKKRKLRHVKKGTKKDKSQLLLQPHPGSSIVLCNTSNLA